MSVVMRRYGYVLIWIIAAVSLTGCLAGLTSGGGSGGSIGSGETGGTEEPAPPAAMTISGRALFPTINPSANLAAKAMRFKAMDDLPFAGATVTVTNFYSGAVVGTGAADADGRFSIALDEDAAADSNDPSVAHLLITAVSSDGSATLRKFTEISLEAAVVADLAFDGSDAATDVGDVDAASSALSLYLIDMGAATLSGADPWALALVLEPLLRECSEDDYGACGMFGGWKEIYRCLLASEAYSGSEIEEIVLKGLTGKYPGFSYEEYPDDYPLLMALQDALSAAACGINSTGPGGKGIVQELVDEAEETAAFEAGFFGSLIVDSEAHAGIRNDQSTRDAYAALIGATPIYNFYERSEVGYSYYYEVSGPLPLSELRIFTIGSRDVDIQASDAYALFYTLAKQEVGLSQTLGFDLFRDRTQLLTLNYGIYQTSWVPLNDLKREYLQTMMTVFRGFTEATDLSAFEEDEYTPETISEQLSQLYLEWTGYGVAALKLGNKDLLQQPESDAIAFGAYLGKRGWGTLFQDEETFFSDYNGLSDYWGENKDKIASCAVTSFAANDCQDIVETYSGPNKP